MVMQTVRIMWMRTGMGYVTIAGWQRQIVMDMQSMAPSQAALLMQFLQRGMDIIVQAAEEVMGEAVTAIIDSVYVLWYK